MYNAFWWRDMKYGYNFGDEIVPWLLNKMIKYQYKKPCSLKSKNILFSIGSILWAANKETTIWGSGIISVKENINIPKKIYSVRGLFSRKKLLDCDIDCPESYGDPAILLPKYYNKKINKKYELGIIPHIMEYQNVYNAYKNIPDIKIINLKTTNIELIIDDILSCNSTVCSALHGLIVSIAYNIPTRWIKFSNNLFGDGIKYYDFFSSINNDAFFNFDWEKFKTKDDIFNPIIGINNKPTIQEMLKSTVKYDIDQKIINDILNNCPFIIQK